MSSLIQERELGLWCTITFLWGQLDHYLYVTLLISLKAQQAHPN